MQTSVHSQSPRKRLTPLDWLAVAGGLVNLAVVAAIFGYAWFGAA
jgi:hypothetical protein